MITPARYTFTIENFQSIQNLTLEFSKFTALIGPTNRGKSAIIRALDALLHNNYHPVMLREGAEQCTLSLTLHDHPAIRKITLIKNAKKGINTYYIQKADGTLEEHPKSGQTTPFTMHDAGIRTLETDRGQSINTNIHTQHEPLFVLMNTETQITDIFNALFQTNKIEQALLRVNKDSAGANKDYMETEAAINRATHNITTRQAEVADGEQRLHYLTYWRDYHNTAQDNSEQATKLSHEYTDTYSIIVDVKDMIATSKAKNLNVTDVIDTLTVIDKTATARDTKRELEDLYYARTQVMVDAVAKSDAMFDAHEAISVYQAPFETLQRFQALKAPVAPPNAKERIDLIDKITVSLAEISDVKRQMVYLKSITDSIAERNSDLVDSKVRVAEIDEYSQSHIDTMVCPTCGQFRQDIHEHRT